MCGPAGAGKSTAAQRLERDRYVLHFLDLEASRRGLSAVPLPPRPMLQSPFASVGACSNCFATDRRHACALTGEVEPLVTRSSAGRFLG